MGRYPNVRKRQGLLVALALLAAGPAWGQNAPEWQAVDPSLGAVTPVTDYQGLKLMFPDSASVRRRLLNAYLEAERPADALREAVELVERGYVFSPAAQELLLTLGPTDEQRNLLGFQAPNGNPIEASRVLATVPAEIQLVESVWRDPRSGDLFVTSVVSRALHVRRGEGAWELVPIEGAGSLSGMAFDSASGLLWVASGVFDPTPDPATAFRGLIAIDPVSGEEKRRIAAPEGGSPSDLTVGADGTLFASDPVSGAVYRGRAGASALETLMAPGTLRSPQGLVALAGTASIVVSDYAYGLALIDTSNGTVRRVAAATPVLLDGIDGLWLVGGKLIGVQNGARPMRIVELALSPDGAGVITADIREKAHSAWTEPVGGSISGDELVYVATGQWDRFGDGGVPSRDKPPGPTQIRVLSLSR